MRLHGRARSPEVGEGRARCRVVDHEIRQVVEVNGSMAGGQHGSVPCFVDAGFLGFHE